MPKDGIHPLKKLMILEPVVVWSSQGSTLEKGWPGI
jgi:hypothetical protein